MKMIVLLKATYTLILEMNVSFICQFRFTLKRLVPSYEDVVFIVEVYARNSKVTVIVLIPGGPNRVRNRTSVCRIA